MMKMFDAVNVAVLIAIVLASGSAHAINKCVSPSGEISFSDTPCPSESKSNKVILRDDKANNTVTSETASSGETDGKRYSWQTKWPTIQAYKEYYCSEGSDKVYTPDEMIARAKAISKGDLLVPDVEVCCVNKKPVDCKSHFGSK